MNVNSLAKTLWDYSLMGHEIGKADCIIVFGSHDTRVAERGAELYLKGMAPWLVFTGGLGRLTEGVWDRPEARIFADIAVDLGVPPEKIIIEDKSTNTGENILFTKEILCDKGICPEKIIAVQKPYMERRVYAAVRNYWPEVQVSVTSPQLTYEEYCIVDPPDGYTRDDIINIIVGDVERVKVYPELGYQVYQEIPREVAEAFEKLVELGFDRHLLRGR